MFWRHNQQSNFVFTVPILLEGNVYTHFIQNVTDALLVLNPSSSGL